MKRRSGVQDRSATKPRPAGRLDSFAIGLAVGLAIPLADYAIALLAPQRSKPAPEESFFGLDAEGKPAWRRVLTGTVREFNRDRIPAAAAGVTFFVLLALFPGLAAFVSLYGLFGDVHKAGHEIAQLDGLLPAGGVSLLNDQFRRLTALPQGSLGVAFAISLLASLWSANAGMKAMIESLNVAYEAKETRGFFRLTLMSLGLTTGLLALAIIGISALVAAPATSIGRDLSSVAAIGLLRAPALAIGAVILLSVLYRFGPCRGAVKWRWITPGGLFAGLAWVAMSALFSWYVANFGHYDRTYGSLGAVAGFMTWIWLSLMVVLAGAELNDEIERHAGAPPPEPV